jgi:hypothetical protein
MAKENGGIIGVVNTPTQSVASGVWALKINITHVSETSGH